MGIVHPFKPRPPERKRALVAAILARPAATDGVLAAEFGISRQRVQQLRREGGMTPACRPGKPPSQRQVRA